MKRNTVLVSIIFVGACGVLVARLLTLGPDAREAERLYRSALELKEQGHLEDALVRLKAALAHDPESIIINRTYQGMMLAAGRGEEVREEYRARALKRPHSVAAQYLAGRLEEGTALEEAMLRCLKLDPHFIWAHRALGRYCVEREKSHEAIEHLETVLLLPEATAEDAGTLLSYLYNRQLMEDIERIIARWELNPPPWSSVSIPLESFALGQRPNGIVVQLHAAYRADVPFVYAIRFCRTDQTFRQIAVRRDGSRYVTAWTTEWSQPGQTASEQPPETRESPHRPTFTEVHSAAISRLLAEKE